MNIWLINPYDELPGEGTEGRYARLAREMAGKGTGELGNVENGTHHVLWVSSAFRHRGKEVWSQRSAVRDRGKHAERAGNGKRESGVGFKLVLVDAPGYKKNISVRRLWSQWVWGRRVEKEMMRRVAAGELGKPDVILASSPPLEGARAGLRLAKFFGAKGIVDVMDDWPETWLQVVPRSPAEIRGIRKWGIRVGLRMGRLLLLPWFRLARQNMQRAGAVSAQSHAFAARAEVLGFQGEVHVCYLGGARSALECGPDEGGTALDMESGTSQAQDRTPGMFHIIYLGAMGHVYDIETVLQAAVLARKEGCVWSWSMVGNDPDGKWQDRAEELGLAELVKFTGYLQGEDLDRELSVADVGLIPMDPRSGVAVPYKAGAYFAAGLPVVNSLPGELAEGLEAKGAGLFYNFGEASSLFQAIKRYAEDPEFCTSSSQAAFGWFEEAFNREKTYPAFAQWIVQPS